MIPRFKPQIGLGELAALFKFRKNSVHRFEKAFADKFHATSAVAFSYGRSAQWAFFKALGIQDAEVIMPAYTCSVVAHAVSLSGNKPRFIDIDDRDFNMNLSIMEETINEKTRAIIATHTFGYAQDVNSIKKIVKDAEKKYGHKIWIIQDCCHAFDAEWEGKPVSVAGDVAVYAFNISKLMTSIFGGMLTFQDDRLADKVRAWRDDHYKKPGLKKRIIRSLYLLAVTIAFNDVIYGLTWWLQEKTSLLNRFTKSFHLDDKIHFPPDYLDLMQDVEAEVGLIQLKKHSSMIDKRRQDACWYEQHLPRKDGWIYPPLKEGSTYSHYVIQVPDRTKSVEEMASNGVHVGELIQYSIPDLACYHDVKDNCPVSLKSSKNTINLPLLISPRKRQKVRSAVNKCS